MTANHKRIEDTYSLSPLQEGMLFHSLHAPKSGVYVTQVTCKLTNLDTDAFRAAWEETVQRHPILRTAFAWKKLDQPLQIVGRSVTLPLEIIDWSSMSPDEQETQFRQRLDADREEGYPLSRAPLMRLLLMDLGGNQFRLIWSHHHILLDGWSVHLLIQEVFARYTQLRRGNSAAFPPIRPYGDYIRWLGTQDHAQAATFWRDYLSSFTPSNWLPPRKSEADSAIQCSEERLTLSLEDTTRLTKFAQEHQLTVNTLVQAAWAVLHQRHSGEDRVTFGSVVSGRPPELGQYESMIGLFINTLPVHIRVSNDATISDWLAQLQQQQADTRRFEFSPLVKIKEWANIPADTSLFETMYVFENYPVEGVADTGDAGVEVSDYHVEETINYPLTLVAGCRECLSLKLLFDSSRFNVTQIAAMLSQLQTLLMAVADGPENRLGQLTILTAQERDRIATEWNETTTDYPQQPVHKLFEARAAERPDAIAVTNDREQISYGALNQRANQIANWLLKRGLIREEVVGLSVGNSLDLAVGALAILKAGGAYLPLDPSYPAERVAYMLKDAHASMLVTHSSIAPSVERPDMAVLLLDTGASTSESGANLNLSVLPGQLAYVMYTSGSTGRPKGIGVPHRAIVRLVCKTNYVEFNSDDCVAQASNHSFDAATYEVWGSLLHGGKLVAVDKHIALSSQQFAAFLREQHIDVMFITTALFHQIAREEPRAFATLRHFMVGGQALDPRSMRRVLQADAPTSLAHVYGPTESTTFATTYLVHEVDENAKSIPIGKPISNTNLHVVDKAGELAPIGVPGELYIGGDGLATMYYGRPELTAEKFVPDSFAKLPGQRLYCTGDRVLRQEDGNIDFIGRFDNQVKLRGFRIEPGEIEAALLAHPDVAEAIVLCRTNTTNDLQLVAYLIPATATMTTNSIRDHLRSQVPDYMIPSVMVSVEAWPLTPNGKVDLSALPDPSVGHFQSDQVVVGPRNPLEEVIAGIFTSVLDVPQLSIHDNFFELGGHSLLATRAISRLREAVHTEVPLRCIFESPSVAELASVVASCISNEQGESEISTILPADRNGLLPLSFGQQRLWFVDQLAPGNSAYNFHAALRFDGELNIDATRKAIAEIVRRHEVLRTVFDSTAAGPVQRPVAEMTPRIDLIDISELPESPGTDKLRQFSNEHAKTSFDLAKGPLLRVTLVRISNLSHAALITMHHIVCDGWSMGIFVREFGALYLAFSDSDSGESTEAADALPALSLQYADFAAWQRNSLARTSLDTHLAYWKQQLRDLATLSLPTDYPRPAVQTFRGARVSHELPQDLCARLRELTRAEGTTLFMTLLAAFKVLLARHAGQKDIVVGADIANRNRRETEDLIGFFANQLVLRSDLSGNPTFRELLNQVREVSLDAYAHQDVSFDKLVEALQPTRDTSRNPLFQVMFILQNNPMPELKLPGLDLHPLEFEQETTAFDLTLSITEVGDATIRLSCRYYADIFSAATIEWLLRNYEFLLKSIVENPKARIHSLAHVSEADVQAQVSERTERKERAFGKLDALRRKLPPSERGHAPSRN